MDHRKGKGIKKKSTSASLTNPFDSVERIITNCGKFLKRWEYQITIPVL